jgi:hypothetical protein
MRAAFYKSTHSGLPGVYNRFVRWWDHGTYSHCELVFSDGMSASASYMDGGVRFKQIEFDPLKWDFVELPGHLEDAARAWFVAHEGRAYDLLGNLRFMIGPLPLSRDKWFCSSALASSLGLSDGWRFSPNALYSALKLLVQNPPRRT